MASPRDEPYVWVTWISKLLAGEAHCQWAAWFKAHHTYQKRPSDFNVAAWTAEHTEMVRDHAERLRGEGYEIYLEGQNAFRMRGSDGTTLAGKPDIVAVRGGAAKVVDCKTGNPKTSDQLQVLVYMLTLPHTHPACRGLRPDGEIRYRNDAVPIPASQIPAQLRRIVRETMHRVGGDLELPRVPSYDECRFCDISAADCPDRVERPPASDAPANEVF